MDYKAMLDFSFCKVFVKFFAFVFSIVIRMQEFDFDSIVLFPLCIKGLE